MLYSSLNITGSSICPTSINSTTDTIKIDVNKAQRGQRPVLPLTFLLSSSSFLPWDSCKFKLEKGIGK
jgi:hypothetical protein